MVCRGEASAAGMKHLNDNKIVSPPLPHSSFLLPSQSCFIQNILSLLFSSFSLPSLRCFFFLSSCAYCAAAVVRVDGLVLCVWVLSKRVSAEGEGSPRGVEVSHGERTTHWWRRRSGLRLRKMCVPVCARYEWVIGWVFLFFWRWLCGKICLCTCLSTSLSFVRKACTCLCLYQCAL